MTTDTKLKARTPGSLHPAGSAPNSQDRDQYFRDNKWGVRIIKRGGDYDVAEVVKCIGFPDEQILGRAMWPDHANTICEEHNDSLAKALFPQDAKAPNHPTLTTSQPNATFIP